MPRQQNAAPRDYEGYILGFIYLPFFFLFSNFIRVIGRVQNNARHIFLKHVNEDLELSREEGFFLGEGATAKCEVVIRL